MNWKNSIRLLVLATIWQVGSAFAATEFDLVVSKDDDGGFATVQEAIDAVPDFRENTTTIFIKNGV